MVASIKPFGQMEAGTVALVPDIRWPEVPVRTVVIGKLFIMGEALQSVTTLPTEL